VTSAPRFAPSSLNCTPTTPTLSAALAETVVVPATVAPAAGAVIETVGGVLSLVAPPGGAQWERVSGKLLAQFELGRRTGAWRYFALNLSYPEDAHRIWAITR
jgi:hypothetical protein